MFIGIGISLTMMRFPGGASTPLTFDRDDVTFDRDDVTWDMTRLPTPAPSASPAMTLVSPGGTWAGTATTAGAPADTDSSIRTTSTYAKPGADILTDMGGLVVDSNDLVIGIHAYAGNASGPLTPSVQLWIEGATFDIPFGSYSYTDANGNARTIWGYFAQIDHSAFTMDGAFNVKWNVTVPDDATYQNRTVGPFTYTRVSFVGHDVDVTVGSGGDYPDLVSAFAAFRTAGNVVNPRVTFITDGTYEMGQTGTNYVAAGYCTLEAAPGVVAHLVRAGAATVNWIRYNGLRLRGSGIRVDLSAFDAGAFIFSNVSTVWKPTILDGCVIYNSAGLESKEATRQKGRSPLQNNGQGNGFIILDDTLAHDLVEVISPTTLTKPAWLVRNLRCEDIGGADVSHSNVTNYYGMTVDGQSLDWFTSEIVNAAAQIQYSTAVGGAATTATWQTTAVAGSASSQLILKKDGSTVATIALNTNGSDGYRTIADIKVDVEANAGWTLTVQNDIKDAQYLTDSKQRTIDNQAVPATNCKDVASQMYTIAGFHGDMIQPSAGSPSAMENVLVVNVVGKNLTDIQALFLTNSVGGFNDVFVINFGSGGVSHTITSAFSQTGGNLRNFHLWHCSFADQKIAMRNGLADAYSSMRGSIFRDWALDTFTAPSWSADSNFIQTRTSNPPNETNKKNLGSTVVALLTDPDNGDLTPKTGGGLATISSLVAFDLNNDARGATSHIGAIA